MADNDETIEILFGGLAQKSDARTAINGTLRTAINVEFDKAGSLNKRRGYRRVTMQEIHDEGAESVYCNLAVFQGELLVYGSEYLYSVGDIGGATPLSVRGPVLRGNGDTRHIASSTLSEEQVG